MSVVLRFSYTEAATGWRCSVKKVVFRNLAKFTGKHLCQSFFLNKVVGVSPSFYRTPLVAASGQSTDTTGICSTCSCEVQRDGANISTAGACWS